MGVFGAKMKLMLEILADEAGFLLDKRIRKSLEEMPPEDAQLQKAEMLLNALGVQEESEVKALVDYFFPAPKDDEDDSLAAPQEEKLDTDAPEALKELSRVIQPDDVIRAVTNFIDSRRVTREDGGSVAVDRTKLMATSASGGASASELAGTGRSLTMSKYDEKGFWDRATNVVPEEKVQVYKQLEKSLHQYNTILTERAECIDEVQTLRSQNASLQDLLRTYPGARVNDELLVPPSSTITA